MHNWQSYVFSGSWTTEKHCIGYWMENLLRRVWELAGTIKIPLPDVGMRRTKHKCLAFVQGVVPNTGSSVEPFKYPRTIAQLLTTAVLFHWIGFELVKGEGWNTAGTVRSHSLYSILDWTGWLALVSVAVHGVYWMNKKHRLANWLNRRKKMKI